MDDLVYERDAQAVLDKRNDIYGWLSAEAVMYSGEPDADELSYFSEHVLGRAWSRRERLPLNDDKTTDAMGELRQAIEDYVSAANSDVTEEELAAVVADVARAFAALDEAIEAAAAQTSLPREAWAGEFEEPSEEDDEEDGEEDEHVPWWEQLERALAGKPGVDAWPGEESCDIFSELVCRFGPELRSGLRRVRVVQNARDGVWLEASYAVRPSSLQVDRFDLESVSQGPDGLPLCSRAYSVLANAAAVIASDGYTLWLDLGLLDPEPDAP